MSTKDLDFHIHSRKPFADESAVMDAVKKARRQVGQVEGAALFKGAAHISAAPTVIPRAVDIIRDGMDKAVEHAVSKGYTHVLAGNMHIVSNPLKRSGVADALGEVSESLRRLGIVG